MASPAQCEATRANAQASTGTSTDAGKSASSRNAAKFGLFSTNNCILPGEEREYDTLCKRLWLELDPVGALEEANAAEYVRAVWLLRRCAVAEERLGRRSEWLQQDFNHARQEDLPPADPAINPQTMAAQASVDRARAQAENCMRRAKAELDKLQATRSTRTILQNEPIPTSIHRRRSLFCQRKLSCKTKPIRSPCQTERPAQTNHPSKVAPITECSLPLRIRSGRRHVPFRQPSRRAGNERFRRAPAGNSARNRGLTGLRSLEARRDQ